MVRSRKRPARETVAQLVAQGRDQLAASAIAGGLARARPRTRPQHLADEARRFVDLLRSALPRRTDGRLEDEVAAEVRGGALAAADDGELDGVFAVWHGAAASFAAAALDPEGAQLLDGALDRLRRVAGAAARAWEARRVDVVAVGASAGGIPALGQVLAALDERLPATVLVIVHLAAAGPSLLPVVLARETELVVAHAVEGAALYLGYVYVAPPGQHLVADRRGLHLVDGPQVHFVKPSVDVLFESVADAFGPHAVAVVLSGTGADGATGTRAVHDHGGVTVAQDPASAQYGGMPEAAITTGAVDQIVSLCDLGPLVERLVRDGRPQPSR